MQYIYVSSKGGKPLNIGVNQAKRIAHRMDKNDRARIVRILGAGMPIQAIHHSELVRSRHRYYHEQYTEPTWATATHQQGARECARRRRQMDAEYGQVSAS